MCFISKMHLIYTQDQKSKCTTGYFISNQQQRMFLQLSLLSEKVEFSTETTAVFSYVCDPGIKVKSVIARVPTVSCRNTTELISEVIFAK